MSGSSRSQVLTILCILSFIGSGLGVLGGLLGLVGSGALSGIPGMQGPGGSMMFTLISLVLSAASLYGVWLMWNLKKQGFSIYAGANVVALIVGFVSMSSLGVMMAAMIVPIVITAGFIYGYYTQLGTMS